MDISKEDVVPLSEASARFVPRLAGGRKKHTSSVKRWGTTGIGGVRLEMFRVGGMWCTSQQALQRFFDRLTVQAQSGRHDRRAAPPPSSTLIETALDDLGI